MYLYKYSLVGITVAMEINVSKEVIVKHNENNDKINEKNTTNQKNKRCQEKGETREENKQTTDD